MAIRLDIGAKGMAITTQTAANTAPETVRLDFYKHTDELRLQYATEAIITAAGVEYAAKTRDIAARLLRLIVKGTSIPLVVDECVAVRIPLFQENAPSPAAWTQVHYRVVNTQVSGNETWIIVARSDLKSPLGYTEYLEQFIDIQRRRHGVDAGDIVTTQQGLIYARLFGSATMHVPLFFARDECSGVRLRWLGATLSNAATRAICLPLLDVVPWRELYQTASASAPQNDCRAHATAVWSVAPNGSVSFLASMGSVAKLHERISAGERFLKIQLSMLSALSAAKLNDLLEPLQQRAPDLATALAQELQTLAAVGTLMDITDALATWMNVAVPALSLGKNGKLPARVEEVRLGYFARRSEERYLARTRVELTLGRQAMETITRDFSVHGLALAQPEGMVLHTNDSVTLTFLSFKNEKHPAATKNIPYRIVDIQKGAETTYVSLRRELDERSAHATEFLQDIIQRSKEKLKLCVDHIRSGVLACALESIWCANPATLPLTLMRNPTGGARVAVCGVTAPSNIAAALFSTGRGSYEFSALGTARFIAPLMGELRQSILRRPAGGATVGANVYAYGTSIHPLLICIATPQDIATTESRDAWIATALRSSRYRFYRLTLTERPELRNLDLDRIIEVIQTYAKHRAQGILQDMESIVAIGELSDITDEIVGLINDQSSAGGKSCNQT